MSEPEFALLRRDLSEGVIIPIFCEGVSVLILARYDTIFLSVCQRKTAPRRDFII